MELRRYRSSDCKGMAELFYDTVHSVNSRDYTPEQLDAWADGNVDSVAWDRSFKEHFTVVAEIHGNLAGFGDMDRSGYLDRLYVSRDYQRQGVAAAICRRLEQWMVEQRYGGGACAGAAGETEAAANAACLISTHASITARPFFEKRGYRVIKEQQVERRGQKLTNYVMVKDIHDSHLHSGAGLLDSGLVSATASERGEGI